MGENVLYVRVKTILVLVFLGNVELCDGHIDCVELDLLSQLLQYDKVGRECRQTRRQDNIALNT